MSTDARPKPYLIRRGRAGQDEVTALDRDLAEAIYRNFERLPAESHADLPLKRVWMLVQEDTRQ